MIGAIRSIARGGQGILFHEGNPVFIPGVLEEETVEFSLLSRRRGIFQGKLEKVITPSPFRVQPVCRHYAECGGCNFQHVGYAQQLAYKKTILLDNLKKIARLAHPPECQVLPSPPYRYRTRLELQVRDGATGFFKRRSRQVIPVRECWLAPEAVQARIGELARGLRGVRSGQLLIVGNGVEFSALLVSGDGKKYLSATREIVFQVGGFAYSATPQSFFQANLFLLPEMLDVATESLPAQDRETACDLFCGIGFFTMPLARNCARVFALENDAGNLAMLRRNLRLNKADNVRVVACDLFRGQLPSTRVYVADPPRGGLGPALVERIAAAMPSAVLLFSCDSATFSRDLSLFGRKGYRPDNLKLIDNFPQSDHFEIFSVLRPA